MSSDFWKTVDLKKLEIPEEVKLNKIKIVVTENRKSIYGTDVFYREAKPFEASSNLTLILLHGRMFSSKTWLDLGTIHYLAAMGHHTIAIDIPGYGNSPASSIEDRCAFLCDLIDKLNIVNPVIVSPSLSGYFTLPFIIKHWDKMAGYIPVAPVGFEILEKLPKCTDSSIIEQVYKPLRSFLHEPLPDLNKIKVPTMVVFGENDRSKSSALLSLLPNSQIQEIPNGGHPAYLTDPELWHKLLYNFLHHVSQHS